MRVQIRNSKDEASIPEGNLFIHQNSIFHQSVPLIKDIQDELSQVIGISFLRIGNWHSQQAPFHALGQKHIFPCFRSQTKADKEMRIRANQNNDLPCMIYLVCNNVFTVLLHFFALSMKIVICFLFWCIHAFLLYTCSIFCLNTCYCIYQ